MAERGKDFQQDNDESLDGDALYGENEIEFVKNVPDYANSIPKTNPHRSRLRTQSHGIDAYDPVIRNNSINKSETITIKTYCTVSYRLIMHLLLLYAVIGVTILLFTEHSLNSMYSSAGNQCNCEQEFESLSMQINEIKNNMTQIYTLSPTESPVTQYPTTNHPTTYNPTRLRQNIYIQQN